jgi:hypothetical protein
MVKFTLSGLLVVAVYFLSLPAIAASFDRFYGLDFHGGDYDDRKGVTLDECQYFCNRDDRCVAYSYILPRRWCWLKDSESERYRNPDVVSGVKGD